MDSEAIKEAGQDHYVTRRTWYKMKVRGPLFKKMLRISRQLEQSIKLSMGPSKHRVLCACTGHTSTKQVPSRAQAGRWERRRQVEPSQVTGAHRLWEVEATATVLSVAGR